MKEDYEVSEISLEDTALIIQNTNDKEDIDTIKDVMETEVLCKDFKTSFNCLKATKTEPWDQWAMDIVEIRG